MNTCEHKSCREPRNIAKSTYIRSVYVKGVTEKLIFLLLYKKLYPLKRLVCYDLIIYSFFIEKNIIFPITLNRAPTWYGPSWWSYLNVTKLFWMSFNACMWYVKLLCDLSCRTTPVILYHYFYFVVVNFSWASRAWCIFKVKISGTKTSKPILALAFC